MLSDRALWRLYAAAIASHVGVAGSDVFSVAGVATFSGLGSADAQVGNWCTYQLGDAIPAAAGAYAPRSGLFAAYWLCLSYLVQSAAAQPGLLQAAAGASGLQSDLTRYRQAVLAWRPGPATSTGANFAANVAIDAMAGGATAAALDAHRALLVWLGGRMPALTAALNRCLQAAQQEASDLNMAASLYAAGTVFRCPQYAIDGWLTGLAAWRAAPAGAATAWSVSVPPQGLAPLPGAAPAALPGAAPPDPTDAGSWPSFLDLHASGGTVAAGALNAASPSTTVDGAADGLLDEVNGLTLSLGGIGVFALSPGNWFDARLLGGGQAALPAGAPDFFSAAGALALLPTGAVIGYQPRVTLRAGSPQQAQALATALTRVGPFAVQGMVQDVPGVMACRGCNGTEVSFDASGSDVPVLLGVISKPVS